MSNGNQSPGGRATSDNAAQSGLTAAGAAMGSDALPRHFVDAVLVECCAGPITAMVDELQALLSVVLHADLEREERDALTSAAQRIAGQVGFMADRLVSFAGHMTGRRRNPEDWICPRLADEAREIARVDGLSESAA